MRYFFLILAIVATSVSGFLVREADLNPVMLASYRLLVAAIVLFPIFLRLLKKHPEISLKKLIRAVAPPALLLGAELTVWNTAVEQTRLANASLLINMMPLAMPAVLWFLYKERVNRREIMATGIAVSGLVLLVSSDLVVSPSFLIGDGLALLAMVMLTIYLSMSRRLGHLPSIWLYVVPMYAFGGLVLLVIGLATADSYFPSTGNAWMAAIGLGLLPTVVGHSMLNWCMQRMRGQIVALVNMLHPVFAGFIGFFAFAETPTTLFYVAGAVLTIAVLIVILGPEKGAAGTVEPVDVTRDGYEPDGTVVDLTDDAVASAGAGVVGERA